MPIVKTFMALLALMLVASLALTIVEKAGRPEIAKMANISTVLILFVIVIGLLTGLIGEVTSVFHVMQ